MRVGGFEKAFLGVGGMIPICRFCSKNVIMAFHSNESSSPYCFMVVIDAATCTYRSTCTSVIQTPAELVRVARMSRPREFQLDATLAYRALHI